MRITIDSLDTISPPVKGAEMVAEYASVSEAWQAHVSATIDAVDTGKVKLTDLPLIDPSLLVNHPDATPHPKFPSPPPTATCKKCGISAPLEVVATHNSVIGGKLWCCYIGKKICLECCGLPYSTNRAQLWCESGYASQQWQNKYALFKETAVEATKSCAYCNAKVPQSDPLCYTCNHWKSCCICNSSPQPELSCADCGDHVAVVMSCCSVCIDCDHVEDCSGEDDDYQLLKCTCSHHAPSYTPLPSKTYTCPCGESYADPYSAKYCHDYLIANIKGYSYYDPDAPVLTEQEYREQTLAIQRAKLPWVQRGDDPTITPIKVLPSYWEQLDPVNAMADFYLLEFMSYNDVPNSSYDVETATAFDVMCGLAKQALNSHVATIAPILARYVDIAVGGELRHHPYLKSCGYLKSDRSQAWWQWLSLRAQLGPQLLLDAANMFEDGRMSGNIGGARWAAAARLLYQYETGKFLNNPAPFPAWLFVDRVWTMQHNGGSLLNKVGWKGSGGPYDNQATNSDPSLCTRVGDAHASNPTNLSVLYFLAQPSTRDLFNAWWTARNRARYAAGLALEVNPVVPPVLKKHPGHGGVEWYFKPAKPFAEGVCGFYFPVCWMEVDATAGTKYSRLFYRIPNRDRNFYVSPDGKWRGRTLPPILKQYTYKW